MDRGKGDGHGRSFCSSPFYPTCEEDLGVGSLYSLPFASSIFYANEKKRRGGEIMGREGGLSLFLFNRFNLFRFFYLDGKMWLFMLDTIKELNKQIPP